MATIDYKFYEEERDRADAAERALAAEHELYKDMRQKYLAAKEEAQGWAARCKELENSDGQRNATA